MQNHNNDSQVPIEIKLKTNQYFIKKKLLDTFFFLIWKTMKNLYWKTKESIKCVFQTSANTET
jgi:hypothetical protein